ncbi:hypothetical protein L873DRAFT_1652126, partial [Choiromyces venosus 120613-1]
SIVFNSVISFLYNRFKNILHWDRRRLTLNMIKLYAQAIEGIGGPVNIWGFVDGTLRSICQPEREQHQFYTGYKQCHAIKFQGITTPDGLIASLGGPFEGKLSDWMVW